MTLLPDWRPVIGFIGRHVTPGAVRAPPLRPPGVDQTTKTDLRKLIE
jgi:hypothetical protein